MYWNVLHLNAERFIPILTLLTEPDTVPVLIHCVAGRDRTGVIVALIRAAVGVPEVFIAEDFALSSQLMALGAPRPEVDHLFGNITDIPREDIIRAMANATRNDACPVRPHPRRVRLHCWPSRRARRTRIVDRIVTPVTDDRRGNRALIRWAYRRLLEHYGRPTWEATYAPVDELIGTILSQHTSDLNSQRAFDSLTRTFSSWEAVRDAAVDELIHAIRTGGLGVVKAHRIQAVLRALTDADGGVRLPDLRRMRRKRAVDLLTGLPGVGRKTAACVLLFGSHVPAIPVDTHVHRVSLRVGLVPPRTNPEATTDALEAALDAPDHYAFHVNVIRLGREICKAPRPRCDVCPLRERCHFARQSPINSHVGLRTRTPRSRR